ncbi:hypothetical protein HHO41_00075 [Bacillus sp. DNRA2]|uniref:hypothetical protein n=1 Tax=Bacillus sp. DNRA2 TaxID=2723053 RepID=UPI00145CE30B|nr:hypothetical protein [Bacillus sp. DNRA2]NMD68664.1 hypothetical protein [Bacillus sp. DNRA2]
MLSMQLLENGGFNLKRRMRNSLILAFIVIIVLLAFIVIKNLKWPSSDINQIQVGYEIDDETQQIIDSRNTLNRNNQVIFNVVLKEMVEKRRSVPIKLILVQSKTNKEVFCESREEFEGSSGFSINFDATKIESGDYEVKLYQITNC